jgi:predicted PurR-regulated permease PerM
MTLKSSPFYLQATICLFGIALLGLLIYLGQDIIVPIAFSILLAILLLPITNWLEKRGVSRVISILISILIALITISSIVYFLSVQIAGFADDLPAIKKNLAEHARTLQNWVQTTFNISSKQQTVYINTATEKIKSSGGGFVQQTLLSLTDMLVLLVLIPIYTFLMMYYRHMLRNFFMTVFKKDHEVHVKYVLSQSKSIVQNYMVGLMIEMAIVAVLNTIGFMIIGIQHAIFLAVLAAILNLVPYIGMLIANIFCMLITLTSAQSFADVIWVGLVLALVQFIDNNFLMPRIVGNKVKLNALITIIGVLICGTLSGVSGMFLAIPFIAILKTIFDRVDDLKPWGMLLGDEVTVYKPGKIYQRVATTFSPKPKAVVPQKVNLPAQDAST